MKRIKFLAALMLIFAGLAFTSCSSDDDSAAATPTPTPPNASTGDYWPSAVNNQWDYDVNGTAATPTVMVSADVIGGEQYYTFNTISANGSSVVTRLKKDGGNYYFRYEEIVSAVSTTTGSEVILLKDYAPVGETWTEDYDQVTDFTDPMFPSQTLHYHTVAEITDKDVEATVKGTTYTNVIKVIYQQEITADGFLAIQTNEYWFAKDVGPILIRNITGAGTTLQELTAATIN